jgi:pimeloyl-ACP methyl ester carboxylesterase
MDANHEVTLSAGTIRYHEAGSGTPILFVHGLLANRLLWRKVTPQLQGLGRVIAPDWPLGSHTTAMKPDADTSPRGVAHLIAEFLETLELTDAVVVGNDTGGAICQVLVTERPERVGRLVLTNCDAFEHFPPAAFKPMVVAAKAPGGLKALMAPMRSAAMRQAPMAYGLLSHGRIPDDVTEAWVRPVLDDPGVRRDAIKVLKGMSPEVTLAAAERFGEFMKPVLVAWGMDDKFFSANDGRRLATLFPNGRFEEIRPSRTFVSEDQPERLGALIKEFVREPVTA